MFKLTYVEIECETSISIWELEMMIELKWEFCFHFSPLHD